MDILRMGFLLPCIALFAWSVVRWQATSESDQECAVRRDMALLLAFVVVGQVGDLVRSRFADRSTGFFACSLALIGIAIAALFVLWRLIRAYRRSHGHVPPSRP